MAALHPIFEGPVMVSNNGGPDGMFVREANASVGKETGRGGPAFEQVVVRLRDLAESLGRSLRIAIQSREVAGIPLGQHRRQCIIEMEAGGFPSMGLDPVDQGRKSGGADQRRDVD